MLEVGTSYCSNKFSELVNLRGEKIKGVFQDHCHGGSQIYLLFESGFALWFSPSNGSYSIESPKTVSTTINRVRDEAEQAYGKLEEILELAGEKNTWKKEE